MPAPNNLLGVRHPAFGQAEPAQPSEPEVGTLYDALENLERPKIEAVPSPKPESIERPVSLPVTNLRLVSQNGSSWMDFGLSRKGLEISCERYNRTETAVTCSGHLRVSMAEAKAFLASINAHVSRRVQSGYDILDYDYSERGHRFAFLRHGAKRASAVIEIGISEWMHHAETVRAMLTVCDAARLAG